MYSQTSGGKMPAHDVVPSEGPSRPQDNILHYLRQRVRTGDVVELRALGVQSGEFKNQYVGYYDSEHLERLATDAAMLSHVRKAAGVYLTLNPVNPELIHRLPNAFNRANSGEATNDKEIVARTAILIDVDPVRLSGISSTDEEKAAARESIDKIRQHLDGAGWPAPIFADSGNGYHLQYRCDLPTEDERLVERFLKALAAKFNTDTAKVDVSVHNPARIARCYGTFARKGGNTEKRPHRLSAVLEFPEPWECVFREKIEAIAGPPEVPKSRAKPARRRNGKQTDGERARECLAALNSDRFDDRDSWLKIGMACHDADPSIEMRDAWIARSQESPQYKDGDGIREWDGFKAGGGVTKATLFHFGQEDGWQSQPNRRRKSTTPQEAEDHGEPPDFDPDDYDPFTSIIQDEGRTDAAFARRYLSAYGDIVQWVPEWSKWIIWDGTRWHVDVGNCATTRMALAVSDAIWGEASSVRTEKAIEYAHDMSKPSKWASALKAAAAQRTVAASDLNTNGWLLNCPNGTVDLRTGELRPHRKEDNITTLCPTEFDPEAASYSWDRFLESLFDGDDVRISFMRRLIGYTITGEVSEQIMPIAYGEGSNGKSTLLNAILDTLGKDYAIQGRAEMLMARKGESHPTELADLHGRRFVSCVETEDGRRLAEGLVKQLTGGERVRARRLYEDFWEFQPTHKVYLCTNHKPEVRGTDHAIWRRLVLIPFTKKYWNPEKGETGPEELRQDKTLPHRLKAEASGILAWAVRGCQEWRSQGLNIPDSVRAATNAFRSEQDVIDAFIAENCVSGLPHYVVKAADLYAAYCDWCEHSGEHPMKQRRLGQELSRKGIDRYTSNGTWYRGVGLRDDGRNGRNGT